jgi:hypothetical protein
MLPAHCPPNLSGAPEVTKSQDVLAKYGPRNATGTTIDWRFTTADARIRLKKLYPVLE